MNNPGLARSSYANVGKEARVMSANSHQLITILFEELLNLLDEIHLVKAREAHRQTVDQQMMALSIIDSLSMTLDMQKGGELANNLNQIYGQVRRLIAARDAENFIQNNRAAHQIMSEIHSAWAQIG